MKKIKISNIILNKYKVYHFEKIDSTNLFLKNNYSLFDEYSVITSDSQTNGRGRLGRTWISNKENIAISILLKNIKLDNVSKLSLVVGASVYNTISNFNMNNKNLSIKWPNDILLNNKKVCGILLESIISNKIDALIIGVGINVNQLVFEDDIKNKATSLKKELNLEINKNDLVEIFIKNFDYLYQDFLNGNDLYMKIIKENSYLTGKTGYINNQIAKILDINSDGTLKVLIDGIERNIYSGEVSLEKFYE